MSYILIVCKVCVFQGGKASGLRTRKDLVIFLSDGLKIFLDKLVRNSRLTGSLATSEGVNPLFSSTSCWTRDTMDLDKLEVSFFVSQKLTVFLFVEGWGVLALICLYCWGSFCWTFGVQNLWMGWSFFLLGLCGSHCLRSNCIAMTNFCFERDCSWIATQLSFVSIQLDWELASSKLRKLRCKLSSRMYYLPCTGQTYVLDWPMRALNNDTTHLLLFLKIFAKKVHCFCVKSSSSRKQQTSSADLWTFPAYHF